MYLLIRVLHSVCQLRCNTWKHCTAIAKMNKKPTSTESIKWEVDRRFPWVQCLWKGCFFRWSLCMDLNWLVVLLCGSTVRLPRVRSLMSAWRWRPAGRHTIRQIFKHRSVLIKYVYLQHLFRAPDSHPAHPAQRHSNIWCPHPPPQMCWHRCNIYTAFWHRRQL